MKDLDFEELDKAVNSLVSKTQAEHGVTPAQNVPSVQSTPTPMATVSPPDPIAAKVAVTADKVDSNKPAPHPTRDIEHGERLGAKRPDMPARFAGHRFMDIVAPKPVAAPSKAASRTAQTVQPTKDELAVADTPSKPSETAKTDKKEASPKPDMPTIDTLDTSSVASETTAPVAPAQTTPTPKSNDLAWPDPLDFNDDFKDAPTATDKKADSVDEAAESSDSPKPPDDVAQIIQPESYPAPAVSPFLAEAKVQKRPLGAYSSYNAPEISEPETTEPAEQAAQKSQPSSEQSQQPDGEQEDDQPLSGPATSEPNTDLPESDVRATTMMSIPQQYKAPDHPVDSATRPVFDTEEYHPPLLEATTHRKSSSMWSKLFIALLILVVLVVAGYFIFMYVVKNY